MENGQRKEKRREEREREGGDKEGVGEKREGGGGRDGSKYVQITCILF